MKGFGADFWKPPCPGDSICPLASRRMWCCGGGCGRTFLVYYYCIIYNCGWVWSLHPAVWTRRSVLPLLLTTATSPLASPPDDTFQTTATGRQEYTNAITASRDTNISPAEAYDVIRDHIPTATSRTATCVDVGAGAGLSTSVLYNTKGYHTIAAVDWSREAWDASVTHVPDGVQFYAMDDVRFFQSQSQQHWDCIVYNFAVNTEKAQRIARTYLASPHGVLLAPCNDRAEYWYKQSYLLLNANGERVWKSDAEVGAWSGTCMRRWNLSCAMLLVLLLFCCDHRSIIRCMGQRRRSFLISILCFRSPIPTRCDLQNVYRNLVWRIQWVCCCVFRSLASPPWTTTTQQRSRNDACAHLLTCMYSMVVCPLHPVNARPRTCGRIVSKRLR